MTDELPETARLRLRRIGSGDAAAMLAVYGDAEAMRWVGDGKPLGAPDCARWIEVTQRNYDVRGYGMFAIVESASGDVVGFCGLVHPGGQAEAELKYALRRSAWGKGFATEAATALLACGAERFGLDRVIATVAPENAASCRVLAKAGMRPRERRRNDDGTFTQVYVWEPKAAGSGRGES